MSESEKGNLPVRKTPYERRNKGEDYWCVDSLGVAKCVEFGNEKNIDFTNANYYTDPVVAENNARAEKLLRQLRKFAVENNKYEPDWGSIRYKWEIMFNYNSNDGEYLVAVGTRKQRSFSQIYFSDQKTAQKAIEKFRSELMWYFTEYTEYAETP